MKIHRSEITQSYKFNKAMTGRQLANILKLLPDAPVYFADGLPLLGVEKMQMFETSISQEYPCGIRLILSDNVEVEE